jgi:hypothetical protein
MVMSYSRLPKKLVATFRATKMPEKDKAIMEDVLSNLERFTITLEELQKRHENYRDRLVDRDYPRKGLIRKTFENEIAKKRSLLDQLESEWPVSYAVRDVQKEMTDLENQFIQTVIYPENAAEIWDFLDAQIQHYINLKHEFNALAYHFIVNEKHPFSKEAKKELDALNSSITFADQMISHRTASRDEMDAFKKQASEIQRQIRELKPKKELRDRWANISSYLGFGLLALSMIVGTILIGTGVGIVPGIAVMGAGLAAFAGGMGVGAGLASSTKYVDQPQQNIKKTQRSVASLFNKKIEFDQKHDLEVTKEKIHPKK